MAKKYPERKVGIVTFSDDVEIIGDGSATMNLVKHVQCDDYDFLLENSSACSTILLSKPIL